MARDPDTFDPTPPSGWTVGTSHAFFVSILKEMNLRIDQRFENAEKAVQAALASVKEATATQKEAVLRSEESMSERFKGVNEFRALANDILAKAMPRNEADQRFASISEAAAQKQVAELAWKESLLLRLTALDKKMDMHMSEREGSRELTGSFRANVTLFITIAFFLAAVVSWLLPILRVGK